jgi:hypothetical protein
VVPQKQADAELAHMVADFAALKQRHKTVVAALRDAISELSSHIYARKGVALKTVDLPADTVHRLMIELHAIEDEVRSLREQILAAGMTLE